MDDTIRGLRLANHFGIVLQVGPPRPGKRQFGVPVGGAFDLDSYELANALVGRAPEAGMWELSMAAAEFTADQDGCVAVTGATAEVQAADRSGQSNAVFAVRKGDAVKIAAPSLGCRTYVQFGTRGRVGRIEPPRFGLPAFLVPGTDFPAFPNLSVQTAILSRAIDRVGIRTVARDAFRHNLELPSQPMTPGGVQVTPAGELVIIGPDGPVTGGYPIPFVVAAVSLSVVAQWRPGQSVEFRLITPEEARRSYENQRSMRASRVAEITAAL